MRQKEFADTLSEILGREVGLEEAQALKARIGEEMEGMTLTNEETIVYLRSVVPAAESLRAALDTARDGGIGPPSGVMGLDDFRGVITNPRLKSLRSGSRQRPTENDAERHLDG